MTEDGEEERGTTCARIDPDGSIHLGPNLTAADTVSLWAEFPTRLRTWEGDALNVDLSGVRLYDTSGVVLVAAIRQILRERSASCDVLSPPPGFAELLAKAEGEGSGPQEHAIRHWTPSRVPTAVGAVALDFGAAFREGVTFLGETAHALTSALIHPRSIRWSDLRWYLQQTGAEALPVVALICFLMGVIMAFQAAVQLHDFGADIYVADLVGLSITRELGPLMVAVICAGRSGASYAAEIGTMKVGEEVDALVTMGLCPMRFLVVPKILALVVALPCLTLLGDVIGVAGGLLISKTVLSLPAIVYINETLRAVSYADVFGGLAKSVVFALLIAGIGCYYGLRRTGSSAQNVGRVTTTAVVTCIFFIILSDALFTVVYHFLGI